MFKTLQNSFRPSEYFNVLFTTSYAKKRGKIECRNTGTDVLNAVILSVNA